MTEYYANLNIFFLDKLLLILIYSVEVRILLILNEEFWNSN